MNRSANSLSDFHPELLPCDVPRNDGEFGDWERIEDYLDHLCAPLVGVVPYAERQNLRFEAREHLLEIAAEFEAEGQKPETALTNAMQAHGEPWRIGESFLRAWDGTASRRHSARPTQTEAAHAFAWFGMETVAVLLLTENYVLGGQDALLPWLCLAVVLAPIVAGGLTGWNAPVVTGRGTLSALVLLIGVSLLAALSLLPDRTGLYIVAFQLIYWLPVGCGAARLTRRAYRAFRRAHYLPFAVSR